MRVGVDVKFVKRLHAKVYWSRAKGALIGSANLTANALGEGALQEAMVWVPPGAFDMPSFIRSLRVENDRDAALRQLHEGHTRFAQRNPTFHRRSTKGPLPSFAQWLARGNGRAEWRLGWYEEDVDAPADAVKAHKAESGTAGFETFLGTSVSSHLKAGVFTLSFRVREVGEGIRVTALEWWAPEGRPFVSKVKSWKKWPFIWFARIKIPVGTTPPFDALEPRFRQALEVAIHDSGGLVWLNAASLIPTKKFLKCLIDAYRG